MKSKGLECRGPEGIGTRKKKGTRTGRLKLCTSGAQKVPHHPQSAPRERPNDSQTRSNDHAPRGIRPRVPTTMHNACHLSTLGRTLQVDPPSSARWSDETPPEPTAFDTAAPQWDPCPTTWVPNVPVAIVRSQTSLVPSTNYSVKATL